MSNAMKLALYALDLLPMNVMSVTKDMNMEEINGVVCV